MLDSTEHLVVRLSAYAARSCAVRAQWDVVRPCEPESTPPFRAGLAHDGIAFEADVVAELVAIHPDAFVIDRVCRRSVSPAAQLRNWNPASIVAASAR